MVEGTDGGYGLLDRENELEVIGELLEAARAARGRLVGLVGPPGIGKTSLLRGAIDGAAGVTVLRARGSDLERELPFGVAMQLFERELREASPAERRRLLSGPADLAAGLLERRTRRGEMGPPGGDPALELIHGLYWLVLNLSAREPLVIAIDDLHWADALSQRMLLYLTQRLEEMAVGIVAAWRPAEPDADHELLERLHREPAARIVEPQPLSEGAVATMLDRALPGSAGLAPLAARCRQATGGNPLYVSELIAALAAGDGLPDPERLEQIEAPGIARAMRSRLDVLPPAGRVLAEAMAVLDADVELDRAALIAGLPEEDGREAAEELLDLDLLRRIDPPSFRHPVVREAIYAGLEVERRAALHAAAAVILRDQGAAAERIAAHLQRCGPLGERWAADALLAAGVAARERGAPIVALPYLQRALDETGDDVARGDVLVEIGIAELAAGHESGLETLREGLGSARDPASRALARIVLGWSLGIRLRSEEGVEVFEGGIDELAPGFPDLAHTLEANLILWAQTFAQNQRRAAPRIAAIAADPPSPMTAPKRMVLSSLALDTALAGDVERAGELAESALGDGAVLTEAGASAAPYYAGSIALAIAERLQRSDELLAAATEDARERGSLAGFVGSLLWRSWVLWRRGRLADAEAAARDGLEQPAGPMDVVRPVAVAALAAVLLERGELEEAVETAATIPLPPAEVGYVLLEPLREVAGRLAVARGEPEAAIEQVEALGSSEEQRGGVPNLFATSEPWGTEALLAAGRDEEARDRAEAAEREARRLGTARALASALRAKALVEPDRAVDRLGEAVDVLDASPLELERARAKIELGRALRRDRRAADARSPLSAGLDLADRCGATALAEHARRELVAAGARPRRAALSGPDSLTGRELDICRLAAEGRSNREIAAELYISPRTVQSHLRTSYRKLGIGGREDLGGALGEARR